MEGSGDSTSPADRGPRGRSKAATRIFWGFLAVALLFSIVGISVVGVLGWKDSKAKVVRLTYKNLQGSSVNQSTITDKRRNTVTYRVTSRNQTSVVLFDSKHNSHLRQKFDGVNNAAASYGSQWETAASVIQKFHHGLVCYKAAGEKSCFLRRMEMRDMENIHSFLNMSVAKDSILFLQNNRTRYYREFLGVIGGRKVNHELVGEPVQILCDQLPIYWVKKSEGPTRRLIYLCIDICFPNNICVSVCFYYLPD